jgi:hypothetical protein
LISWWILLADAAEVWIRYQIALLDSKVEIEGLVLLHLLLETLRLLFYDEHHTYCPLTECMPGHFHSMVKLFNILMYSFGLEAQLTLRCYCAVQHIVF